MSEFRSPDWTLARYAEILDSAARYYVFEPFGTTLDQPHVLWRHDIDYSVDRALSLARLEAERSLKATYFFLLGSVYYNPFHPAVRAGIREIARMGHWIALHFDPQASDGEGPRSERYEREITREAAILADLADAPVRAVSFHNPDFAGVLDVDAYRLGGLVNAYAADIRQTYTYASDSFGYWRHTPLHQVIARRASDRLHVLTHPVWWCQRPEGSRKRIADVAESVASAVLREHDQLLQRAGMFETVRGWDEERKFHHPPDHRS